MPGDLFADKNKNLPRECRIFVRQMKSPHYNLVAHALPIVPIRAEFHAKELVERDVRLEHELQ